MSLVLQNFFTDPKLASISAGFILFLPAGVALLALIGPVSSITKEDFEANNWVQYLYFLPTFPFEVVLTSIFAAEGQPDLFETSSEVAWVVLVLLTPCYYFLHIYLESVIPDAYGINESCCFCFRRKQPIAEEDDDEI